jgi:hypothetical protein
MLSVAAFGVMRWNGPFVDTRVGRVAAVVLGSFDVRSMVRHAPRGLRCQCSV